MHSDLSIGHHEYVKQCQKLQLPVKLVLLEQSCDHIDHTHQPNGVLSSVCLSRDEANSLINSYFAKQQRFHTIIESRDKVVIIIYIV